MKALQGAIHKTLDAIWSSQCILLGDYLNDIVSFLNHKTPSTRSTTITWVHRCFSNPLKRGFGIKREQVRPFATQLVKSMDDVDASIRNCTAEVLAALVGICGEKMIGEFIEMLDTVRQKKVKELIPKYSNLNKTSASKKKANPQSTSSSSSTTPSAASTTTTKNSKNSKSPGPLAKETRSSKSPAPPREGKASSTTPGKRRGKEGVDGEPMREKTTGSDSNVLEKMVDEVYFLV